MLPICHNQILRVWDRLSLVATDPFGGYPSSWRTFRLLGLHGIFRGNHLTAQRLLNDFTRLQSGVSAVKKKKSKDITTIFSLLFVLPAIYFF